MDEHRNAFTAIKESKIISTVLRCGINAAANDYNLEESEVTEIVLRGIQEHQDVINSHQETIAKLHKSIEEKDERKSSSSSGGGGGGGDEEYCYICETTGHVASRDCKGAGCSKCGHVGHMDRDCKLRFVRGVGSYSAVCYYCGLRGCKSVCSLCGETGHLGKDCW